MNILLVTEFFPNESQPIFKGGVQARTFHIAQRLNKENNVEILSLDRGNIEATSSSIFSRLLFLLKIIFYSPEKKPEVIEASNVTTFFPTFILARRFGVPCVAWIPDILTNNWWKNFSFPVAIFGYLSEKIAAKLSWNQIIAMSKVTKNKLIGFGFAKENITVIYGGVDYFKLTRLREKKSKTPTISTISRLVAYKRIDDLIKAVALVRKVIPDVQCQIIGEGPDFDNLMGLARKLNLKSTINFLGNMPHSKALKTLKRSHIFCLPSVVEGFGIVTIESMASGVPFVSSKIAATLEITRNGKGGLLYEPGNEKDLASKIIKLLSDKKLYKTKVREGMKLAKKYDWDIIAKQTFKIYEKTVYEKKKN